MFGWKFSLWSYIPVGTTMPLTPSELRPLGSTVPTSVGWNAHYSPCWCEGKEDILDMQSFWHLRNKDRQLWLFSQLLFWHFKTEIDTAGKLGKFPLLFPFSWTRWEKENSFWFYFSSITWQALKANAFFIPPEYWPLHPNTSKYVII